MSSSVEMKKAEKWAAQHDSKLQATDEGFRHEVRLVMEDGTSLYYDSAFAVTHKKFPNFLFVFTEHYGTHVFSLDDVKDYRVLVRVGVREIKS